MPRHYPDQTTVQNYIADVNSIGMVTYSAVETMGASANPGYKYQSRGRRENYVSMRTSEALRNGFGPFLSETESNERVGDAARKHFPEVTGQEQLWKSCVHAVDAFPPNFKGHGKKFGHDAPTGAGREYHDIPRGMKHVAPPQGHLAEEMDVFDTRRGRVFTTTGVNLSNAQSVPSETSYSEHPQRRHGDQGDRNGVPMRTPGDKMVASVEFTPAFFGSQKHRLGLEPPVVAMQRDNRFAEKEVKNAILRDKQDVANLPKYPKLKPVSEAPPPIPHSGLPSISKK
uniref:Uncharacterized protein n=1 Tax=Bodo saltans TaxID=75058 RepID=B6DTN3_BODSA|nr:hypothetical protein [Bodo saltans]